MEGQGEAEERISKPVWIDANLFYFPSLILDKKF
jgi:hypothetical protein